jgi:hypothetical protein
MNTVEIIEALEHEKDLITQAISALKNRSGRSSVSGRRRRLSAAARRRISEGMKRRWAERKKSA